jgi:hypothetical protein
MIAKLVNTFEANMAQQEGVSGETPSIEARPSSGEPGEHDLLSMSYDEDALGDADIDLNLDLGVA